MFLLVGLLGCAPGTGILALGDSVLEWNGRDAIPEVAAEMLGMDVQNNAIGGTRLIGDIPETYEDGDWSWVLVDGGANDLNDVCGCSGCDSLLNQMVGPDGGYGVMVDLIERITGDGHQVAILGYYQVPNDAPEFTNCSDFRPDSPALTGATTPNSGTEPKSNLFTNTSLVDPTNGLMNGNDLSSFVEFVPSTPMSSICKFIIGPSLKETWGATNLPLSETLYSFASNSLRAN